MTAAAGQPDWGHLHEPTVKGLIILQTLLASDSIRDLLRDHRHGGGTRCANNHSCLRKYFELPHLGVSHGLRTRLTFCVLVLVWLLVLLLVPVLVVLVLVLLCAHEALRTL